MAMLNAARWPMSSNKPFETDLCKRASPACSAAQWRTLCVLMGRELKKYASATLGLAALVSLSSCSWITDFVIANTSQSELSVSYLVSGKSCPDDNFIIVPARKDIADLEKDGVKWQKLTSKEYTCNENNFVVTTTLPPRTALLVARVATYTGSASYGNDNFQVLRLELKGSEGEISLKGLQVLKAFKFESKTLFILHY